MLKKNLKQSTKRYKEPAQTGNASGQASKMNHLHFEVRNTSARTGGRLNPLTTINELNKDVVTNPDRNKQTGN
ncbi:hypothetical protein [Flavobacterium polysaccharolyticum]|uniref:Peptidase family M23 n=1 Tax=Flavobacterium polysaccharolyticum TaxID=3133148 RepID=A0ABU9NL77_9FLAO